MRTNCRTTASGVPQLARLGQTPGARTRMKRAVLVGTLGGTLIGAVAFLAMGIRSAMLFRESRGSSEPQDVRLDIAGKTTFQVSPPGRSLFRPGGVIRIELTQDGRPWSYGDALVCNLSMTGHVEIVVFNRTGQECLRTREWETGVGGTALGTGAFLAPAREFDTSAGGPYRVDIEVTEPVANLKGVTQTLTAKHFVCGNERVIHWIQFGVAAGCLVGGLLVAKAMRSAKQRLQNDA